MTGNEIKSIDSYSTGIEELKNPYSNGSETSEEGKVLSINSTVKGVMQEGMKPVDMVVINDFSSAIYSCPLSGEVDFQAYRAIDDLVKVGGRMVVPLNELEVEKLQKSYETEIGFYLPNFSKVDAKSSYMVYEKKGI